MQESGIPVGYLSWRWCLFVNVPIGALLLGSLLLAGLFTLHMRRSAEPFMALRRTRYRIPMAAGFSITALGAILMAVVPRWGISPYAWLAVGGTTLGRTAPGTTVISDTAVWPEPTLGAAERILSRATDPGFLRRPLPGRRPQRAVAPTQWWTLWFSVPGPSRR